MMPIGHSKIAMFSVIVTLGEIGNVALNKEGGPVFD
jgi:hypothetical protein